MKKLIIIGALLLGLALQGLAQTDVITPGMNGLQTRNALNTAFSEMLGVVDTVNETVRIGGIQITANAAEINILDNALVNVTELNRLVGLPDNIVTLLAGKENSLGNPGTSGYVLSSTTAGVRSWIAPGGGAVYPAGSGIPFVVSGTSWGTTVTTVSQTELGYIDGLNGTAASRQDVEDSLDRALAGAVEVIARVDSATIGDSGVGTYVTGTEYFKNGYNLIAPNQVNAGSNIKARTIEAGNTSLALSDGLAYYVLIHIPLDCNITGVYIGQSTQGSYTADNYNGVALYTLSAGTITRVALSADDGDIWKTASNGLITKAFSSPYNASAGYYVIGLIYNSSAQTTAPTIQANGAHGQLLSAGMANSIKYHAYRSGQTTLPASENYTNLSSASYLPQIYLY